jgi:hypothetical protein
MCITQKHSIFSAFIAKPTKAFALCQAQPNNFLCGAQFLHKMLLGSFVVISWL